VAAKGDPVPTTLPANPSPLLDRIPDPDAVVAELGRTAAERRYLRQLLKLARLKAAAQRPASKSRRASR
jgi:hypothetical protein